MLRQCLHVIDIIGMIVVLVISVPALIMMGAYLLFRTLWLEVRE